VSPTGETITAASPSPIGDPVQFSPNIGNVDEAKLTDGLKELFDKELLYHGFTSYLRDYELVVFQSVDPNPRYGLVPRHVRLLFRFCTEADVRSTVSPELWSRSLDDSLLDDHTVTRESAGYVWGIQCQVLYPGAKVIERSKRARNWERRVGIPFHEVLIEGNAQTISLVFSDLVIDEVGDGYTPYRVGATGVPERYGSNTKIPFDPD
jgi:hypothetical protein